jgi:general secretion pathway protein A
MYCEFYQLRERPFNVTADPKFLYLNARYREALASLQYGISQRKGFITLIGEAGTGKTTLLKKLLDDLDSSTRTVFIFNTNVTFDEILEYIFAEFDLPVHNGKRLYMLQRLNAFLLEELQQGRNVALLIDEAQDLDQSALEDLRLLSNLETAKEKILQIVLSGQPELGQKLGSPALRQLRQRVAINCRLLPLTREEISEYIQSRLIAAGGADPKLFTRDAEDRIYEISMGIPRLVNVVCDNALVIGYALAKRRIGAEVVTEAAADLLTMEPAAEAADGAEAAASATVAVLPRARHWSQLGFVAVVLVAIVVGLLSVGRSLLRQDSVLTSDPAVARPQFEVINPGARVEAVAPPRGPERAQAARAEGDVRRENDPSGERPAQWSGSAVADLPNQVNAAEVPQAHAGEKRDGQAGVAGEARPPAAETAAGVANPGVERLASDPLVAAPSGQAAASGLSLPGDAVLPGPPDPPAVGGAVPSAADQTSIPPEAPAALPEAPADRMAAVALLPRAADSRAEEHSPAAERRGATERTSDGGVSLALQRYKPVTIRPGQSISELAVRQYGQASYTFMDVVKLANPTLRNVDVVSVGQVLQLPELDDGHVVLQLGDGRYGLLLLSSPAWQKVKGLEAGLRQRGFSAQVQTTDFGPGRTVYRLLIGGMSSREAAVTAGRKVRQLLREDEQIAALAR